MLISRTCVACELSPGRGIPGLFPSSPGPLPWQGRPCTQHTPVASPCAPGCAVRGSAPGAESGLKEGGEEGPRPEHRYFTRLLLLRNCWCYFIKRKSFK